MEKATGSMEELREFLAEHALKTGNRHEYLELQFAQATDYRLTLKGYTKFREICQPDEWEQYESRVLAALNRAWNEERIRIHLARGESLMAAGILANEGYRHDCPDSLLDAAIRLQDKYPEQVLAFYESGLGDLNSNATRPHYARNADILEKMRRIWVEIMKTAETWEVFAREVKTDNQKRRAFQEEAGRRIKGWALL